jgi:nicotinamidase-related amidase
MADLDTTALLVIDVQRAFDDDEYWGGGTTLAARRTWRR